MTRAYNFAPGPATLPLAALERAQKDLVEFKDTRAGICEVSHRGKAYEEVHDEALSLLRTLFSIPDTHDILLMQGGAHVQFALIPMNLLPQGKSADYLLTGTWAERAYDECKNVGSPRIAGNTAEDGTPRYRRVPTKAEIQVDPNAAYLHYTTNNTIYGTQFHAIPETGGVPLVADMSSDLGSRAIDIGRFGLVYACAQKNLGPSGVTVVIVRKDLVESGRKDIPKIFRYATHAKEKSLYNTAPTFAIYLMRNVLLEYQAKGGVRALEAESEKKASGVYAVIDRHPTLYRAPVEKASRSLQNVVFTLPDETTEKRFLAEAAERSLINLKGHRSVGGIRVSLYNGMPVEGADALVSFMRDFAKSA